MRFEQCYLFQINEKQIKKPHKANGIIELLKFILSVFFAIGAGTICPPFHACEIRRAHGNLKLKAFRLCINPVVLLTSMYFKFRI